MTDFVNMVTEFHTKYKHPIAEPMTEESLQFRYALLSEEFEEVLGELFDYEKQETIPNPDKAKLTKELSDLLYVTIGFAVAHGLPIREVFEEVHKSNMTKTGDKREDGKILKGPDYIAPNLDQFFN